MQTSTNFSFIFLGAFENPFGWKTFRLPQLRQAILSLRLVFQSHDLQEMHQHGTEDERHEYGGKRHQQQQQHH